MNGKLTKSKYSEKTSAIPKPLKVKGLKATKTKKGNLSVKWNAVNGADGYRVYVRKEGEPGFKRLRVGKNIKGLTLKNRAASSLKAVATPEAAGVTYEIKVRAYRKVDGKKVFGEYSVIKKVVF